VELMISLAILTFMAIQFIEPIISNFDPNNTELWYKIERLLKLALPNTYCWIIIFFIFFHSLLNILSEILYFADRQFYLDWWNCKDLNDYWRMWNLPVHNFMLRHVYNPLLKRGASKSFAMFIVFFISAFFHEYLVSASIRVWSYWAFSSMMIQVPIMIVQSVLKKYILKESQIGNIMFWVSFCIIG
jgi:diacylglycerol O-acyltransferase 1